MRDHSGVAVTLSELDSAKSLGKRTDLVNLYKNGVSATFVDSAFEIFYIGNEEVITFELATVADEIGEELPTCPGVLCHTVFDGIDRIFFHEFLEVLSLLFRGEFGSAFALFPGVVIYAVMIEFGGSAVKTDGNVLSGNVACEFDSLDDNVESIFSSIESRRATDFIADSC